MWEGVSVVDHPNNLFAFGFFVDTTDIAGQSARVSAVSPKDS